MEERNCEETCAEWIPTIVNELRRNFRSGKLRNVEARQKQLRNLFALFEENMELFYGALYKDLKRSRVEANLSELLMTKIEIGNALKNVKKWMKPEVVSANLPNTGSTCEIRPDPLGVVLIIGAWNFPISLIFVPLVGALAAGNCAVLKPSEISEHSAKLLGELIPKYLDSDCVRVINGGVPETTVLLRERFDKIFFTGSTSVGKIIMKAAAEHLTPVTLELGGKCPVVIDNTCNFDIVAQRIIWAKCFNSGQACISPDYILCIGDIQEFVALSLKKAIIKFYGDNPQTSDSYCRMINKNHFHRVKRLIDETKVYYGHVTDEEDLYISPTILLDVKPDDDIMQEEIFGPVLPVLTVGSVDEAIAFVAEREKPLAMYAFSTNHEMTERLSNECSSGGLVVNDCFVHYSVTNLPFGGVGNSGMGSYHGVHSFKTFSHNKAYLHKSQRMESLNSLRYPPYNEDWTPLKIGEWMLTPSVKR